MSWTTSHATELLSNSVLGPALHVYRKLGFVDVPLGPSEYRRADVKIVLPFSEPTA